MSKHPILFFAVILCSYIPISAQEKHPVTEESIKQNLASVVCKNSARLEAVKALFRQMGATEDDLKVDKFDHVENLVLTKKGKTEETIVIGAHYDKVTDGCGAIDNWTGIVILANLYGYLRDYQTDKTYKFVAFGREEEGLIGAGAMAKSIPKENLSRFCSMVNFDSFGFAYPQVLTNVSSPQMTSFAQKLAAEIEMPLHVASLTAGADSGSFRAVGIPAITFHGLSNEWRQYLHTYRDKLENVKTQSVFAGYTFGFLFISKIDKQPCDYFRKIL